MASYQSNLVKGPTKLLLDVLSFLFPVISAVATYEGVHDLSNRNTLAIGALLVAFLFEAVYFRLMLQYFPSASRDGRRSLLWTIAIFGTFAIGLTTTFTVTAFGGQIALRKDFERAILDADGRAREQFARSDNEQALVLPLTLRSQQFADLAKDEESGAFTGAKGHGSASATFSAVSNTLKRTAEQVEGNKAQVQELRQQVKANITELRRLSYADMSQQEKVLKFGSTLNDINDELNQTQAASVVSAVKDAADSLSTVATLQVTDQKSQLGSLQQQAIQNAGTLVAQTRYDLAKATRTLDHANDMKLAPLSVIDEGQAIFKYWGSIFWAYVVALCLDFSPLFFLYVLSVIYDMDVAKRKAADKEAGVRPNPVTRLHGDSR